jgi:hypothetical protein
VVNYDSDEMSEGGGLYTGIVRTMNPRFGYTDYNKTAPQESVALLIDFEHPDAEGNLKISSQIMGTWEGYVPSEDGKTPAREGKHLIPEEEGKKFPKNSPFGIWVASLQKARGRALDGNKGADDMDDLKIEVGREVFPTNKKKDRQCYFVKAEVKELPWASNKKKKATPVEDDEPEAKPAPKKKAPVADEDEAPTISKKKLNAVVAATVKAAGKKGLTVGELPKAMYKIIAADFEDLMDSRQAYAEAACEDSYLEAENDNFNYDSNTGKLTPA